MVVGLMKKPFAWVSKGAPGTKLACPGAQDFLLLKIAYLAPRTPASGPRSVFRLFRGCKKGA